MARVLEPAGFDTVEAGSLQEAADALTRHRPVAVVLDRCLPDGDGLELARRFRDDPRLAACAIVVCSASDRGGEHEEAIRAGADEYVVKPIDTRRFAAMLAELVARRQRAVRTASRAR